MNTTRGQEGNWLKYTAMYYSAVKPMSKGTGGLADFPPYNRLLEHSINTLNNLHY